MALVSIFLFNARWSGISPNTPTTLVSSDDEKWGRWHLSSSSLLRSVNWLKVLSLYCLYMYSFDSLLMDQNPQHSRRFKMIHLASCMAWIIWSSASHCCKELSSFLLRDLEWKALRMWFTVYTCFLAHGTFINYIFIHIEPIFHKNWIIVGLMELMHTIFPV